MIDARPFTPSHLDLRTHVSSFMLPFFTNTVPYHNFLWLNKVYKCLGLAFSPSLSSSSTVQDDDALYNFTPKEKKKKNTRDN
jgi:hypothetical protein